MKTYEEAVAKCYSTWGKSYYDEYYSKTAPYPPVHTQLLRKWLIDNKPKTLLDAGCGPASFLRDITDLGIELYGFDLTPEMVDEAKPILQEKGISPDRIWLASILERSSFKCPLNQTERYDAVVCGGVLPHIPSDHDATVISNIAGSLNPGGIFAIEARNQLFAMFTMNRYSYELFVNELIKIEEIQKSNQLHSMKVNALLEEMRSQFRMDLPPIRKGKKDEPGYDEVLSRTHNPLVLKTQFEKAGFVDVRLMFYHFHAFPPMLEKHFPDVFLECSLKMEANPEDWRGLFMASAFYVVGKKGHDAD